MNLNSLKTLVSDERAILPPIIVELKKTTMLPTNRQKLQEFIRTVDKQMIGDFVSSDIVLAAIKRKPQ